MIWYILGWAVIVAGAMCLAKIADKDTPSRKDN
jgi:hypothetical protein